MSVWRKLAFGLLACSPAILVAPVLAQSGSDGASRFVLAQAETPAAGGEAAEAQAAQGAEAEADSGEVTAASFTEAFLGDPAHVTGGKEVWEGTCQHCHGSKAYPGKAPKLRPGKYTPEFVYDRVTNGFRKMPPWKDILTDEERMNVVAYILSSKFSP
jgi:mono/diheme cytochrome c family protein